MAGPILALSAASPKDMRSLGPASPKKGPQYVQTSGDNLTFCAKFH